MKIATSILSASDRITCLKLLDNTTTDYIHIDAMDNKFVPNYQLPVKEVNKLRKYSQKPFDIHLMVEDAITYIHQLNIDNIKSITFHLEIKQNIDKIIDLIKSHNYEVGLAIKPRTDINLIDKYIDKIFKQYTGYSTNPNNLSSSLPVPKSKSLQPEKISPLSC